MLYYKIDEVVKIIQAEPCLPQTPYQLLKFWPATKLTAWMICHPVQSRELAYRGFATSVWKKIQQLQVVELTETELDDLQSVAHISMVEVADVKHVVNKFIELSATIKSDFCLELLDNIRGIFNPYQAAQEASKFAQDQLIWGVKFWSV